MKPNLPALLEKARAAKTDKDRLYNSAVLGMACTPDTIITLCESLIAAREALINSCPFNCYYEGTHPSCDSQSCKAIKSLNAKIEFGSAAE